MTTRGRGRGVDFVLAAVIATGTLLAPGPATAEERSTLALVPFENVSGNVLGAQMVMPLLAKALGDAGYAVVGPEQLEPFLARNRIRNTGQLSRTQLAALRRELGVAEVLVGSVAIFNDSPENPQWGLSARLLDTTSGAILWAASAGLTGDDFTIALGLGTITSSARLAEETVTQLLRDLPRAGAAVTAPAVRRPSILRLFREKASYRSPTLDSAPPRRVAVLPFENQSERKGAARIVTDIFVTALVQSGRFDVIEPGTVSEALLAIGAVSYGTIDFETLDALGERLEADAVVLGTVFTYSEGLKKTATTSPEIMVDARMLDTRTQSILWLAERTRSGDDSQIVLHFGKIRAVVPLVLRVASEMAETLGGPGREAAPPREAPRPPRGS